MSAKGGGSRSRDHFERLYRASRDPWNFVASAYEQAKYDATLAALGSRRFRSALEVGCSIGVLTERLAARCDRLLGIDFVEAAATAARARCAALPGVSIRQMEAPGAWPAEQFDLVVFSEVLYFFSEADLALACAQTRGTLLPGGWVLLVNYTGPTDDPLSGERAATLFLEGTAEWLAPLFQQKEARYRLDLLKRPG